MRTHIKQYRLRFYIVCSFFLEKIAFIIYCKGVTRKRNYGNPPQCCQSQKKTSLIVLLQYPKIIKLFFCQMCAIGEISFTFCPVDTTGNDDVNCDKTRKAGPTTYMMSACRTPRPSFWLQNKAFLLLWHVSRLL